jgi:hypothetical protein
MPALPTKPLNSIALYDADAASALSFVKQKLKDMGVDYTFTSEQTAYVERLGGRASDLESVSCGRPYKFSHLLTTSCFSWYEKSGLDNRCKRQSKT